MTMPTCQNCAAHVTEDYARVFAPEHVEALGFGTPK